MAAVEKDDESGATGIGFARGRIPVPIFGHTHLNDIGTDDGTAGGTALTAHSKTVAITNGTAFFGPLAVGGLYEFTAGIGTGGITACTVNLKYEPGTSTTAADANSHLWMSTVEPLVLRIKPGAQIISFFNAGAAEVTVSCRRID